MNEKMSADEIKSRLNVVGLADKLIRARVPEFKDDPDTVLQLLQVYVRQAVDHAQLYGHGIDRVPYGMSGLINAFNRGIMPDEYEIAALLTLAELRRRAEES